MISVVQRTSGRCYLKAIAIYPLLLLSNIFPQTISLAVIEFDGYGISATEAMALTNRLRNELFRSGAYDVVERGLMESILDEQDFRLSGCTSNECLVQVGQLLGAQLIVGGSISRVGTMLSVSARIIDVESGKVQKVSDYDISGGIEELLTRGMREVAQNLTSDQASESYSEIPSRPETGRMGVDTQSNEPRVESSSASGKKYYPIEIRKSGFGKSHYYYRGGELKRPIQFEVVILAINDYEATRWFQEYKRHESARLPQLALSVGATLAAGVLGQTGNESEYTLGILMAGGSIYWATARFINGRKAPKALKTAVNRYNYAIRSRE